jgi:hypothetical protein
LPGAIQRGIKAKMEELTDVKFKVRKHLSKIIELCLHE